MSDKMAEAIKTGREAFRRLAAAGFLVLHGVHGEQYSLTGEGKARVSLLVGHPLIGPASQLSNLVSALDSWLLQHDDDDSDDRRLVMAVCTIMQENGIMRLKLGDWR